VLLDAFASLRRKLPDAQLWIVGDGPHKSALEERARKLGLGDAVTFFGFVPAAEKVARLSAAHVAVCPSPKEGWGLTVVEANACGTAVVASKSPGLVDSVRDGETGLLVPHGDVQALTQAIERVLTDPALRAQLETQGLAWSNTFTWERCADESYAVLERTLGSHKVAGAWPLPHAV